MKTRFLLAMSLWLLASRAAICSAQNQKYALIVGITGYPKFVKRDTLRFADRDAKLFYDFITSTEGGGFPAENIRFRTNGEATRGTILEDIIWIGRRATKNDLVYVFFSGHGWVDEETGTSYFMPYDANPELPQEAGFPTDQFVQMLRTRINAKYLVTFIDACHAASVYENSLSKGGPSNTTAAAMRAWHEAYKAQPDVLSIAFLSASANENSYEDPALDGGHGVFTWYLVQGLTGSADTKPRDGVVTAGELYRYILDSVESHVQQVLHARQSPARSPEFAEGYPLGVKAREATVRQTALNQDSISRRAALRCYLATIGTDYYFTTRRCREAIRINPDNAAAHGNLGFALWFLQDVEGARDEWRTMRDLSPLDPYAHANLGRALARLGDTSEGLKEAKQATRLDPDGPGPMAESDILHEYMHDFEGALAVTSDWLRRHPNDSSARRDHAEQYLTTGRFAEAITQFDSLLQQPALAMRYKVSLNTLAIVALVGENRMPEVVARMHLVRTILESQVGKFDVGWTFSGTKEYIRTSTDPNISRWRDWLLRTITAEEDGNVAEAVKLLTPSE